MKTTLLSLTCTLALCACATPQPGPTHFDLGALPAAATGQPLKLGFLQDNANSLKITEISAPAWLDGQAMYYRLNYLEQQQARPYAQHRWQSSPAQLLTQQLRARLAQAGIMISSPADGVASGAVLRIELEDFSQHFSAKDQSEAHLRWRASLISGRKLISQKTFVQQVPCKAANAAAGASALAQAANQANEDVLQWLSRLPATK